MPADRDRALWRKRADLPDPPTTPLPPVLRVVVSADPDDRPEPGPRTWRCRSGSCTASGRAWGDWRALAEFEDHLANVCSEEAGRRAAVAS